MTNILNYIEFLPITHKKDMLDFGLRCDSSRGWVIDWNVYSGGLMISSFTLNDTIRYYSLMDRIIHEFTSADSISLLEDSNIVWHWNEEKKIYEGD